MEILCWILLLLPAFGGILSGWLVYTFAPEAEGHGTDAAINAYHNTGGLIRARVPIIKTIASALTLTTGGSGGREGPIAQIGAGFGSFLATKLKLSRRERRIMMAAGVAAGVGSIFRAPLAGALFAAEVLYRDPEFESEVIIPAGISSVVAYCLFCLVFGWGSLFESPDFKFQSKRFDGTGPGSHPDSPGHDVFRFQELLLRIPPTLFSGDGSAQEIEQYFFH
jgi:CIC family chloride channel protein